jgi:uncharacterized membrane protein
MDKSTSSQRRPSLWRWVLLGIAVALTAVWLFLTPSGLLGKADAVGYSVCHQIGTRAFHMNGRPFPLCARCSGMFLGAMLGLIFQVVQGRKGKMPPVAVIVLFGLMALAWALDGVNSFLMLAPGDIAVYETQNWTRLVTGTGMGVALSAFVFPSFVQTMFQDWEEQSGFGSWKQVLGVILIAVVLDVLLLLEIPWVLYPFALIGSAGVIVLLVMIYSMVLVMAFRKENIFTSFRELWVPLVGGYILAMLQIGGVDLLRYLLTGTWAGFVL